MPFILVKGGADDPAANSYADVADYRSQFGDEGLDGIDLTAIADNILGRHLVSATRFIDQLEWRGEPKYEDNQHRLGLPRLSLVAGPGNHRYREGFVLPEDEVPWVVITAVVILAEEERFTEKTLWRPEKQRRDVLKRKRSLLGSEKKWADALAARGHPLPMDLLHGLHAGDVAAGRIIAL